MLERECELIYRARLGEWKVGDSQLYAHVMGALTDCDQDMIPSGGVVVVAVCGGAFAATAAGLPPADWVVMKSRVPVAVMPQRSRCCTAVLSLAKPSLPGGLSSKKKWILLLASPKPGRQQSPSYLHQDRSRRTSTPVLV